MGSLQFDTLFTAHFNRVYNHAYRMLGNHEDAEEATQDIFLKVHGALDDFRGESALSTWMYRITANECISRLRKKKLDTTSIDASLNDNDPGGALHEIIPDDSPTPDREIESSETAETVRNALRTLQPEWAEALSMYHFDGLSYDEIGKALDLPVNTVGTYIRRGRKELAKKLVS